MAKLGFKLRLPSSQAHWRSHPPTVQPYRSFRPGQLGVPRRVSPGTCTPGCVHACSPNLCLWIGCSCLAAPHARPIGAVLPLGLRDACGNGLCSSGGLRGSGVGAQTVLLGHPPFSMCSRWQVPSLSELADTCQGRRCVPHGIHMAKPWLLSVSVCGDRVFKEVGKV